MWLTASVATISVWELFYLWLCFVSVFNTDPVCVCALSTVLASSWGADEAVNASHWSRQKWLWWVETLSAPLWLCLSPNHLPFYPPTAPISVPLISFLFFVFFAIFIWCLRYLFTRVAFSSSSFFSPFLSSLSLFLPVSPISVPPLCALPPPPPDMSVLRFKFRWASLAGCVAKLLAIKKQKLPAHKKILVLQWNQTYDIIYYYISYWPNIWGYFTFFKLYLKNRHTHSPNNRNAFLRETPAVTAAIPTCLSLCFMSTLLPIKQRDKTSFNGLFVVL